MLLRIANLEASMLIVLTAYMQIPSAARSFAQRAPCVSLQNLPMYDVRH